MMTAGGTRDDLLDLDGVGIVIGVRDDLRDARGDTDVDLGPDIRPRILLLGTSLFALVFCVGLGLDTSHDMGLGDIL